MLKGLGQLFFDCQIAKVIVEQVRILLSYMLFPERKCWSGLVETYRLIRGQPFYCQSSSHSKSLCLNDGYRYLQLLLPRITHHRRIFSCICQEIKPKGGDRMISFSVKLGVFLFGFVIFGCAETWGADWKLFFEVKTVERGSSKYYYDSESISQN